MTGDTPAPPRDAAPGRGYLVAAGLGLVVPAALHLRFLLVDQRLPRDLGNFYDLVPSFWNLLNDGLVRWGPQGRPAPWDSGVWYQGALALWLSLTGPGAIPFRLVDLGWMALNLLLVGLAAAALVRARGGDRGEQRAALAIAVLLAGGSRVMTIVPRMSWLHVVEVGLVFLAAVPWLRDPRLRRGAPLVALAGALALLLRSSGLPWVLPLGVAIVIGVGGERPDGKRLGLIALSWLLAALPSLIKLADYLGPKIKARERYARNVGQIQDQVMSLLGPLLPALLIIGLLGLLALARGRKGREGAAAFPWIPVLLLLAWGAGSFLLWALFRAGLDNFLVGFAALFALAGAGWARWPRVGLALALPSWLLIAAAQLLPEPAPTSWWAGAMMRIHLPMHPGLRDTMLPYTNWGRVHMGQLLDATCPPQGRCVVSVDQGWLVPYSEDAGNLEVFLMNRQQVDLFNLSSPGAETGIVASHALLHYECGRGDQMWRERYPKSLSRVHATVNALQMRLAWMHDMGEDCIVQWWTPGGRVRDESRLPSASPLRTGQVPHREEPRGKKRERPVRQGG